MVGTAAGSVAGSVVGQAVASATASMRKPTTVALGPIMMVLIL